MKSPQFPASWRQLAFDAVFREFLLCFPTDSLESVEDGVPYYSVRTNTLPELFHSRIAMIGAMSKMFKLPEANEAAFMTYIDQLFTTILKSSPRPFLAAAVIRAVTLDLPQTPRNRMRIERFIMPHVRKLSEAKGESRRPSLDMQASGPTGFLSERFASSSSIPSAQTLGVCEYLFKSINQFWCVWYPRPSDAYILSVNASKFVEDRGGYVYRKQALLTNRIKDGKKVFNSYTQDEKIGLIRRLQRKPYESLKNISEIRSPFFSAKSLLTEAVYDPEDQENIIIFPERNLELPKDSLLTFKIKSNSLEFKSAPFSQTIYLHNTSAQHQVPFVLQVTPHLYFTAEPSFGVIGKDKSVAITIEFHPRPFEFLRLNEVLGYICVRDLNGLPIERLELLAYNQPSIKIIPESLDFGLCPPDEIRTTALSITNLTGADATVVMTVASRNTEDSPFSVPASQIVLRPKETRTIPVKCAADEFGDVEDELIVLSNGYGVKRIALHAFCSSSLRVLNEKIDFGPTDIYYSSVIKKMHLINLDKAKPLPVTFTVSTDEIVINQNAQIVLAPGEKRSVPVEFLAAISGSRKEQITVSAPNVYSGTIDVLSEVGPMVIMPISEDIFALPTTAFVPAIVRIPISNVSNDEVRVSIYTPKGYPIVMKLGEPEYSNRTNTLNAVGIPRFFPLEQSDREGIEIKMGSGTTVMVEVQFTTSSPGVFKIPISAQLISPKKMSVSDCFLYFSAVNDTVITTASGHEKIGQFFSLPFAQEITPLQSIPTIDEKEDLPQTKSLSSNVLELTPDTHTIYGSMSKSRLIEKVATLNLTNISSEKQDYYIVVPSCFIIDVPVEGFLPPHTTLPISVRMNNMNYVPEDKKHYLVYGFLTVFDCGMNNPGMCRSELFGYYGELVCTDVRESTNLIRFPPTHVTESLSRRVFLRNKSHLDIIWEASIEVPTALGLRVHRPSMMDGPKGSAETWTPFSLSTRKINLKPFECCVLDINFVSSRNGEFKCRLVSAYTEPYIPGTLDIAGKMKPKINVSSWMLEGLVGTIDLVHAPDVLNFGEVPIFSTVEKKLLLTNGLPMQAKTFFSTPGSVVTPESNIIVESHGTFSCPLIVAPKTHGFVSELLEFNVGGTTHSIPAVGMGGIFSFNSTPADPFLLIREKQSVPMPKSTIQLGVVARQKNKRHIIVINNTGSIDMIINDFKSFDEKSLSWAFEDNLPCEPPIPIDPKFGSEEVDWKEVDWDEIDWKKSRSYYPIDNRNYVIPSNMHLTRSIPAQDDGANGGSTEDVVAKLSALLSQPTPRFPLRLPPMQSLRISLLFQTGDKGEIVCPMRMDVQKTLDQVESYMWWVRASVQPSFFIFDRKIDLGICKAHVKHKTTIKFKNTGTNSSKWVLKYVDTTYNPILKFFDKKQRFQMLPPMPPPVRLFPDSGELAPNDIQIVEVFLTPYLAQHEICTTLRLSEDDSIDTNITVSCKGASSELQIDTKALDFGVMRVGTQKFLNIKLLNKGMLKINYFIESLHKQYFVDPEQGVIEGGDREVISVRFTAVRPGVVETSLVLTYNDGENSQHKPINIEVYGMGSFPELVVFTKDIDFGVALFKSQNRRVIKTHNKGTAEAHVIFRCNHPDVLLELGDDDEIVIGPMEYKDLIVSYIPQALENLDVKVFIRSSDSKSDTFVVALKGTVGIPRMTLIPSDALMDLDFGVMRLNKCYKKAFKLSNDGNIFLTYDIEVKLLEMKDVETDDDSDKPMKNALHNLPSPVTVEPSIGVLNVGEDINITISFLPTIMMEYKYLITIKYDFQSFEGIIHGIGGRALLKLENPLRTLDFGVCRINRKYVKEMILSNCGNLELQYHLRPIPDDRNWEVYDKEIEDFLSTECLTRPSTNPAEVKIGLEEPPTVNIVAVSERTEPPFWESYLSKHGLRVLNPDGLCKARRKVRILVEFEPKTNASVLKPMRFFFGEHFETFDIVGLGSAPVLSIRNTKSSEVFRDDSNAKVDIGVHPVNSVYTHIFELLNEGVFGVDFLVQPMSSAEFDVFPLRGFVEAGGTCMLKVFFQPNSENAFHTTLKILWEGKSISCKVIGNGGLGRLELFSNEGNDIMLTGIDFQMAPFNIPLEKRFSLINTGKVDVSAHLEMENEEYTITQAGDPFPTSEINNPRQIQKGGFISWMNIAKITLPPFMAVDFGVRFLARSATASLGNITIRSECGNMVIPLKGKGGTISLSHKGDLDFGDISCNYVYTRKITIVNGGSIPSQLTAEWLVVGQTVEESSPIVRLAESFTPLDPRSGWVRLHYLREKNISDTKKQLTAKEYWALIAIMVKKSITNETQKGHHPAIMKGQPGVHSFAGKFGGMMAPSFLGNSGKQRGQPAFSMHFKRRQMFYQLITSTQFTSQSVSKVKPYVKVDPPTALLPSYGDVSFNVEVYLNSEDTFLATLVVKSDIANTSSHEISLTATPKIVNIICDDTRTLNFYRQPFGETEFLTRTFTNIGHKDIAFKFANTNNGLTIAPSKGNLKVGQTTTVTFAFKPVDESIQSSDVLFEPNCSQHIRFKMYGGGGYAKASLSRYRRFDFGHCMIGKDTVSFLPIVNEGNAILHMNRFEIIETETFFRGQDWPRGRVSLFPGKSFNLPLVFNPHEENPSPGRLIIGTTLDVYEIELIGLGREAVLIVSKVAVEFSECLIGNSYEQKLGLKNIGDVNYPVTFQLEKEFPDLVFYPSSIVIDPFSESFVSISYTPSHETKTTVVFSVSSPYSTHKIPVMVHAGVANLVFNSTDLDFGMFERTTKPVIPLTIKNTGTVRTSYQVRDTVKPSKFQITPARGVLIPGKTVEVSIFHVRHEVAQFEEKLAVKTDLVGKIYNIKVKGRCEETVLHPEEFSLVNMGICPVLETTSKPLVFKNHGYFPLEFTIKAAYPLKVSPTQGTVNGKEDGIVNLQWNPSGGYELRTQITMVTNIGKFPIIVRGKAMFPELAVNNMYIDFGICAVGHTYTEVFQIENKGKVPLHYTIPQCKETSFSTSIDDGILTPKETAEIKAYFTPIGFGKLTSSIIVECKGVHYKEIVVVGVGGQMAMDIQPKAINVGRCPFEFRVYETITIVNEGDVTLYLDFGATELKQDDCLLLPPDNVTILPRKSAKCIVGISTSMIGKFSAKLKFETKEQSYTIPISGVGIKIILTGRSNEILKNENLLALKAVDPLGSEIADSAVTSCLKRFEPAFVVDQKITSMLSYLYMMHRQSSQPIRKEISVMSLFDGPGISSRVASAMAHHEFGDGLLTVGGPQPKTPIVNEVFVEDDSNVPVETIRHRQTESRQLAIVSRKNTTVEQSAKTQIIGLDGVEENLEEVAEEEEEAAVAAEEEAAISKQRKSFVLSESLQKLAEITLAQEKSYLSSSLRKRRDLIETLEALNQPESGVGVPQIDTVFEDFISIKNEEYHPPQMPEDPIVDDVINYAYLKVRCFMMSL